MRKITIDFGIMRLVDVEVRHRYFIDGYYFELYRDKKFISVLDMKTYKLVDTKVCDIYTIEKRA